jgi:hypothetical protein
MNPELEELIRVARKELRKSSGLPLTAEEEAEEEHKAAIDGLEKFLRRRLGVAAVFRLCMEVTWTPGVQSPAWTRETTSSSYAGLMTRAIFCCIVEGEAERQVVRIEASDSQFENRLLVAIADASGRG